MTIVFADLETTGLDPDRHHIWEIGLIVRDHRDPAYNGEWHWLVRPALSVADPTALRIGRYYERAGARFRYGDVEAWRMAAPAALVDAEAPDPMRATRMEVAADLATILDGVQLVGCVPSFDAAFLARFLRAHRQCPAWHYHLVDVEHLAVGYLAGARRGYNDSVNWLAEWHNDAAHDDCQVPGPGLDRTMLGGPPWSSDEVSRRIGVEPPGPDVRHTALGDARWAMAVYDYVMGQVA